MAGELEGRVSIVTGGGSGMGRATSLLLAREGAAVAIADVNDEGGEQTAAQIEDLGGESLFVHTDVSSERDVVNAVAEAAGRFGKLDSIVTAAGISYANYLEGDDDTDPFLHPTEAGSSLNRPTEFWQKVLDVNLTGVMLCAREAARQMVKEGHGGTIVNFASTAAYNPSPNMTDYCVSKTGVVMLTRCFAAEFGQHGIRVNAVAPGPIETPMLARVHRARGGDAGFRTLPLGRTAQPEEVAELVLFFTSERSSYVTGKTLGVDGGTSTL